MAVRLSPRRRRLGIRRLLSRIAVSDQLGGEIIRDWRPEGLAIRLVIPARAARGLRPELRAALSGPYATAVAAQGAYCKSWFCRRFACGFHPGDSVSLLNYALELFTTAVD